MGAEHAANTTCTACAPTQRSHSSPPCFSALGGSAHGHSHSHSPPRFFRAALLASWPSLVSPSLGSSAGGASRFSLLSPPSWPLSDFLSLSFSRREGGGGFFGLLLMTFCCCWRIQAKAADERAFQVRRQRRSILRRHLRFVSVSLCLQGPSVAVF